ncbi:phosphoribosylformylglycinamidine synthase subunit PurQ [Candidatus Roizmanbacteria bacterium]|nr:phosphoribosylformylglycinamidine synthase subunit PurQ [Candidatus Roizmanbacteria bacterium]
MKKPTALVFSGYGLNCEEETAHAFELAGANIEITHINDIIDRASILDDTQILAFPGGFSYGDDTGSGNAFANRVRNHLWDAIHSFIQKDKLVIGICNGFQILTNLGLVPALNNAYGERQAALLPNTSARYINRWVDVKVRTLTPWLKGIKEMSLPIAHGEGRFYAAPEVLNHIVRNKLVALEYTTGEICEYQGLEANPNGALKDIAGIIDTSGRILGMMPHPERAMFFTQYPNWPYLKDQLVRKGKKIPEYGQGLQVFKNGVEYFS